MMPFGDMDIDMAGALKVLVKEAPIPELSDLITGLIEGYADRVSAEFSDEAAKLMARLSEARKITPDERDGRVYYLPSA